MYSYIIGEFVEMTPEGIVIENNGIGYDIKTSSLTAENIPKSGECVYISARKRRRYEPVWISYKR